MRKRALRLKRSGFKHYEYSKGKSRYGLKRCTKALKAGRKTKAWNATRRQLKREYAQMGITSCELRYDGCRVDDMLSFAHGRKRRKLVGDELKTLTILCCTPCHSRIEFLPPDEMLRIVTETIAARISRRFPHKVLSR